MKFYQLKLENENVALVKTREFGKIPNSEDISDIIKRSWDKWRELDPDELLANEGYDQDNIDDFIEWNNFRNKIGLVRLIIEDLNLDQ